MRRSSFSSPDHTQVLASADWRRCEELIRAFEEAWRRGQNPAIRDFLGVEGLARRALLLELVHIDLEFRLKIGDSARVEAYLTVYPELVGNRPATLDLIAAEYDLRRRYQGCVTPSEYLERFPSFADELTTRLSDDSKDTPYTTATQSPAFPISPPTVPGYEIIAEVGRGGMGVIYQARDLSLGRQVALKFLPPEYASDPDRLERFRREARTASALNHPNICTVHALGDHEGRPFIVMEYIAGTTLRELADRRPGAGEVARLIAQVARALAAAHEAAVVHRDIKPENIMERADGFVKVLDFGLARRLPTLAHPAGVRDTEPGVLLGTVAYMSPEQARGEAADNASDIFALGVVLYELITGRHPFEADSALAILQAIDTAQPLLPSRLNPEVGAALDGLVLAMLHRDARLRPTAADVESTLSGIANPTSRRIHFTPPPRMVVHREPELAVLRAALAAADSGCGSMVCVAGEPGIGKTTLIEDFLGEVAGSRRRCLVVRGHCSERLAGSEAYLPVIEALTDLVYSAPSIARVMKVVAPTWYVQVAPAAGARIPPDMEPSRASSQPAMLREFCSLLEEASRLGPVILFFDDVHWADVPTVDLLAYLGRQCPSMRVLVLVTYRPTELLLGPHPFHRARLELQGRGVCTELLLELLGHEDVERYLALAFPNHAFPPDFADLIHARTDGSPLFMVDLLRDLRERGVIANAAGTWTLARELPDLRQGLPESVRSMIQVKLGRLGDSDRRLLAAAAVQGHEFESAVIARAVGQHAAEIEERLQVLERVHLLVRLIREHEFPDRTLSLRYSFVHALYQEALYAEQTPARRAMLGVALARALEEFQGSAGPAAAELACLYEVGRDFGRAARQYWLAAQNAARVFAHREAVVLARRGLRLIESLPNPAQREALELPLQTTLGLQLQVTEGYAAPAAEQAYTRARQLCPESAGPAPLFPVLWGLWLCSKVRSELARARTLAVELEGLASQLDDPALSLQVQQALTVTSLCQGEPGVARRHMEQGADLYDPERHRTHSFLFGQDPCVACKAIGSVALWLLGFPDAARRCSGEAIQLAHTLSQPSSQALALHFAAMLHQLCRDPVAARACAEACGAIAAEHGFSFWSAGAALMRGWALAECGDSVEGAQVLRKGLANWVATGSVTYQTYYLGLLAEVLGRQDRAVEGIAALDEALVLVRRTGEGLYHPELHRLRGELLLKAGEPGALRGNPEEEFQHALDLSRKQGARSLELRAAISLARQALKSGSATAEMKTLWDAFGQFTEGFESPDLREARELIQSFS